MTGSLDQLIHEAANDAISDGTEKITRKHLHAVILDTAAQEQYHVPARRRPARRFASGGAAGGLAVLNEVRLNQVVAACADARATQEMITALQREGTCWCGPTTWRGRRAMRISISSWAATQAGVDRSVAAVLAANQAAAHH